MLRDIRELKGCASVRLRLERSLSVAPRSALRARSPWIKGLGVSACLQDTLGS